jgi:hypothetical protein
MKSNRTTWNNLICGMSAFALAMNPLLPAFAQGPGATQGKIDPLKPDAGCKNEFEKLAARVAIQNESENARLLKGIGEVAEKNQEGLLIIGSGSIAAALTTHLVEKRLTARYQNAMLGYLGKSVERSAAGLGSATFANFQKKFNEFLVELPGAGPKAATLEKIPGSKAAWEKWFQESTRLQQRLRLYLGPDGRPVSGLSAYMSEGYHEASAALQSAKANADKNLLNIRLKQHVDELVEAGVKGRLDDPSITRAAARYAPANAAAIAKETPAAEKALVDLIKLETKTTNWTGFLRWMKRGLMGGGVASLIAAAAAEAFSSSREAPELQFAKLAQEDPSVLLTPQIMEENGILTASEKGRSLEFACLAYKRHPKMMEIAQKKLIEQKEEGFQWDVSNLVHGDINTRVKELTAKNNEPETGENRINDLKVKPVARDATAIRVPIPPAKNPDWAAPVK